jgi:hypothetical protein
MKKILLCIALIIPLSFLVGFGQYTVPQYSAGALGSSTPNYFLTSSPTGSTRNNLTGWVGGEMNTSTETPTVKQLCRWNVSGNSQTHNVYLLSSAGILAKVSINTSLGTPGTNQCSSTTVSGSLPQTLSSSTNYVYFSQETSGGDSWYDTQAYSYDSNFGYPAFAAYETGTGDPTWAGVTTGNSGQTFGPPNLTR